MPPIVSVLPIVPLSGETVVVSATAVLVDDGGNGGGCGQQQQWSLCGGMAEESHHVRRPSFSPDDQAEEGRSGGDITSAATIGRVIKNASPFAINMNAKGGENSLSYFNESVGVGGNLSTIVARGSCGEGVVGSDAATSDASPTTSNMRWKALALVCLLGFGGSFNYDFPGAIGTGLSEGGGEQQQTTASSSGSDGGTQLQGSSNNAIASANTIQSHFRAKGLSYNQKMNQSLYSVYSYPNMFFGIIGGVLIDNYWGLRKSIVVFQLFCFVGIILTNVSTFLTIYPMMLVGRVIFGIGSETMWIVQSAAISRWFKEKTENEEDGAVDVLAPSERKKKKPRGAVAFGLMISATRLNTSFAYWALPRLAALGDTFVESSSSSPLAAAAYAFLAPICHAAGGVGIALVAGIAASAVSLTSGILLSLYDKYGYEIGAIHAKSRYDERRDAEKERRKKKARLMMTLGSPSMMGTDDSKNGSTVTGGGEGGEALKSVLPLVSSCGQIISQKRLHATIAADTTTNGTSLVSLTTTLSTASSNSLIYSSSSSPIAETTSSSSTLTPTNEGPSSSRGLSLSSLTATLSAALAAFTAQSKTVGQLPLPFWLLCAIAVLCYGSALPFIGIAKNVFEVKYGGSSDSGGSGDLAAEAAGKHHFLEQSTASGGMTESDASALVSLFQIICAAASPLLGAVLDATGRGPMWLALATFLLSSTSFALVFTPIPATLAVVTMSSGYAIFCATLWPFVPLACPEHLQGLGYGLLAALNNCGMATVPLIGGAILDAYSVSTTTTDAASSSSSLPPFAAYQRVLAVHGLLQLCAMLSAITLAIVDEKYNYGILNAKPEMRARLIAIRESDQQKKKKGEH